MFVSASERSKDKTPNVVSAGVGLSMLPEVGTVELPPFVKKRGGAHLDRDAGDG